MMIMRPKGFVDSNVVFADGMSYLLMGMCRM